MEQMKHYVLMKAGRSQVDLYWKMGFTMERNMMRDLKCLIGTIQDLKILIGVMRLQ